MFGWRRRSEGFEWREYVRTTVLVRRADRQRRLDDVRMAAVEAVKEQRDRGVEAGKAGLEAVCDQIARAAGGLGRLMLSAVLKAWRAMAAAAAIVVSMIRDVARRLPRPNLPELPQFVRSIDARRLTQYLPDVAGRGPITAKTLTWGAGALALIVVGGPILRGGSGAGRVGAGVVPQSAPATLAGPSGLTGRAVAIKGDSLRIGDEIIKLSGIEAPESKQPCFKSNGRRWDCSGAATSALGRLVRGRTVACSGSGTDESGFRLATCTADEIDLSAELVRGGHVFAQSGLFASYTGDESTAREAKAGLWQGETVRPQEWRERVWEEAKRTAPDGCPIKGFVRASSRLYAMPWSDGYQGAKVRTVRGERWFCSEDDARAAGFRLANSL